VAVTGEASGPLVRFAASSTPRRQLVCLPFAGGGPSVYRLWPRTLPADVEVLAVVLPGRELPRREQPLDSVEQLVAALLPAIESAAQLPYALFGHSLGAALAFELAVALERDAARPPSQLFVSGRRAPDEPYHAAPVYDLPEADFLDALQERYGGVPEVIRGEPDLLALLLPALRADVRAFETYAPLTDRKVTCPVHVYGGVADRHPRPEQLPGWQRVAENPVRVRTFPGDHFYLTSQREALTGDITAHLADVLVPMEQS
jgi:surfactin synthase thioesterase subunit